VYKRLPEVMESLAVGAYLARSLRAANSLDVVVLQELLERACGITLVSNGWYLNLGACCCLQWMLHGVGGSTLVWGVCGVHVWAEGQSGAVLWATSS
jgi:hypothetical protein